MSERKDNEWSDHPTLEIMIVGPEPDSQPFVTKITGWNGDFNSAISLTLDVYEETRSLLDDPGAFDHIELTPLSQ